MGRYFIDLFIFLALNMAVSFLCSWLIPNYYLAEIISSVIIAFIFAIIQQWVDRPHFYKYTKFWYTFFIIGIMFCLFDLVLFLI